MKARKVKGLDPDGPVAAQAQRLVEVRLDELCSFMPEAADPSAITALHDMRIAAKRLRYLLEVFHPLFGPYATKAIKVVKELQGLLGDIHDCDEGLPEVDDALAAAIVVDARALAHAAGTAQLDDLEPAALAGAPTREAYAGLVGLGVHMRARRELLFERFTDRWVELERQGFRARLEYAVAERPGGTDDEETTG